MDKNSKIVKFYITNEKDEEGKEHKLYCYVTKDNITGKETVHFTEDKKEYQKAFVKMAKDNGYNNSNIINAFIDYPYRFSVNCSDTEDIFERINADGDNVSKEEFEKAKNKEDNTIDDTTEIIPVSDSNQEDVEEDLDDEYKDDYDENKLTKAFKWIKNKIPKTVKRLAFGVAAVLVILGVRSCSLNRDAGPTTNRSKTATVDDTDKNKDKEEEKDNSKTEEANTTTNDQATNNQPTTTTTSYSDNYSYGYTGTTSGGSTQETTPGTVDNSIPAFQDPTASIDNSTDNGNTEKEEDPYQNVITEEQPVDTPSEEPIDEPDQVIDVPADEEENTNKDDIILDDRFEGNEGAVADDNITIIPNDGNEDYQLDLAPLPDPNETAADGDYNSFEEEGLEEVKEEAPTDEFVPVEQEQQATENINNTTEPTTEEKEESQTNSTTPVETVPVEQAVDQAIEAMDNGEDVNIVYHADTNSYSVEQNTNTIEANGITK